MPVHEVRRRLLRGLAGSSGAIGSDDGIDTPTARGRRAHSRNTVIQDHTFYGDEDEAMQVEERRAQKQQHLIGGGHRLRRCLPQRSSPRQSFSHGVASANSVSGHVTASSSTELDTTLAGIEQGHSQVHSPDIIVRDPVTYEPEIVYLRTGITLGEDIEGSEAMEYKIKKHIRSAYGDISRQLNDKKLQTLVKQDLKRMIQKLDDDAWIFEPDQELASDLI
ncbi:hypothetical protein V1511DRAFT_504234 [Dipodascopsis uninucleata]